MKWLFSYFRLVALSLFTAMAVFSFAGCSSKGCGDAAVVDAEKALDGDFVEAKLSDVCYSILRQYGC